MSRLIAGIDPGVKTGMAIWNCEKQTFDAIETWTIVKTMSRLKWLWERDKLKEIWFEDARLRKWFKDPKNSKEALNKLQGAGSIKRDCAIWQEFCEYYNIPYKAIPPQRGATKWDAAYFQRVTGWKDRISGHARDAAILVFGVK